MYIWDYREDGKLVVRAIPCTEEANPPRPAADHLADLKQKVG